MYLLINSDNTVNFADDHPINPALDFAGLTLIEFQDKNLDQIVGSVCPEEALWDPERECVIQDPRRLENNQNSIAAGLKIKSIYPIWKQLNILRSGTQEEIDRMGSFIDACRDWSNDPEASVEDLETIVPSSSTVESSQQEGVIQRITNIWKK